MTPLKMWSEISGQDPNRGTGQVLYAFLLVIIGLIIVFDGFPFPA